ncbi:MAG: carboxypeptidase-like regulatory domain-containing protein [Proteobacteria bacterium]|nr:carboxypeptidase-like regulatory domain-containing protein [Pseudomonadota bacterium]
MGVKVIVCAAVLAAFAALIGFACGSSGSQPGPASLPAAGTSGDDGEGLLARASAPTSSSLRLSSVGEPSRGTESATRSPRSGGDRDAGTQASDAGHGGTSYRNYKFNWAGLYLRRLRAARGRRHARDYRAMHLKAAGGIAGRVTWRRAPTAAVELRTRAAGCPTRVANDTLTRDARGNVSGAVVYLEGIGKGRHGLLHPSLGVLDVQLGGVLQQYQCRFIPHVQIVSPIGAMLTLVAGDAPVGQWTGMLERSVAFRARLSSGSVRRIALNRAGFIEVRDDQTSASAWIVVARHPYYTLTDDRGRFRLDDVPPGTYKLVVWHPPVARVSSPPARVFTPAAVRTRTVEVRRHKTATVTIRLPAMRSQTRQNAR